jgi:hypothetical protein
MLEIREIKLGMVECVVDKVVAVVIGSKVWADPAVRSEERRFVFPQYIQHILM